MLKANPFNDGDIIDNMLTNISNGLNSFSGRVRSQTGRLFAMSSPNSLHLT